MRSLHRVHLNGLRAVEAVGRLGSLQRAADELGVSPGAVSQQVIKTERQLGHILFERTARGLDLTTHGSALVARLSAGFAELDSAVAALVADDDPTLTLSVAPVFASKWLVPRLAGFRRAHPGVRVRIEATTELADPDRSDVDAAIRVGTGQWPDVTAEPLLPQEIFPVCAPELARRLTTPADLAKIPVIRDVNSNLSWDLWLAAFGLDSAMLPDGDTFTDAALCLDAAIAGQGVMLGWRTLAHDAMVQGLLVAPFAHTARSGFGYYLVTSRHRRMPGKTALFRDWLRQEIVAMNECDRRENASER